MRYGYGIYVKTYKRPIVLKRTIDSILKHTIGHEINIIPDDQDSETFVNEEYKDNPLVVCLPFTERRGSAGTWEYAIEYSRENHKEYTIIFEDDCYPYKEGWLDMIDDFLTKGGKNKFTLVQFIPMRPGTGIYSDNKLHIQGGGTKFRQTLSIDKYIVGDSTDIIEGNVFSLIRGDAFHDEPFIVDPNFDKKYGYWHSEVQRRLCAKGANPWRSCCLKQLEEYIYSVDFKEGRASITGGMDVSAKSITAGKNYSYFMKRAKELASGVGNSPERLDYWKRYMKGIL